MRLESLRRLEEAIRPPATLSSGQYSRHKEYVPAKWTFSPNYEICDCIFQQHRPGAAYESSLHALNRYDL
jgi:hypothetical protein